jgi:HSP20 family molecular chaperone IbpA
MNSLVSRMRNGALSRRNDLFSALDEDFHKFFDSFFGRELGNLNIKGNFPPMNVARYNDTLEVKFTVSGMTPEDVQVDVSELGVVTVSGRMSQEHRSKDGSNHYIREIKESMFQRSIQLPEDVMGDPEAVLKDGILTLTWKVKSPPEPDKEVKKIQIKSG